MDKIYIIVCNRAKTIVYLGLLVVNHYIYLLNSIRSIGFRKIQIILQNDLFSFSTLLSHRSAKRVFSAKEIFQGL